MACHLDCSQPLVISPILVSIGRGDEVGFLPNGPLRIIHSIASTSQKHSSIAVRVMRQPLIKGMPVRIQSVARLAIHSHLDDNRLHAVLWAETDERPRKVLELAQIIPFTHEQRSLNFWASRPTIVAYLMVGAIISCLALEPQASLRHERQ
jgi:hypothetical protein